MRGWRVDLSLGHQQEAKSVYNGEKEDPVPVRIHVTPKPLMWLQPNSGDGRQKRHAAHLHAHHGHGVHITGGNVRVSDMQRPENSGDKCEGLAHAHFEVMKTGPGQQEQPYQ